MYGIPESIRGLDPRPGRWAFLLVVAGALGVVFLFGSPASADLVDPRVPYMPTEPKVRAANPVMPAAPAPVVPQVPAGAPAATEDVQAPPEIASQSEQADPEPVSASDEALAETVAPVLSEAPVGAPAPSRRAARIERSAITTPDVRQLEPDSATAHGASSLKDPRRPIDHVRVFLAEVASACKIGISSGSGGPVLTVAVLGMVAALTGHRVLRARLATDEEVPEHLFAWDVIAPG